MASLKKIFLSIIFILILVSLTGCSESAENIENFYYVVAFGIDSIENSSNINLSVQIASVDSGGSSETAQSSSAIVYSVECSSIDSGITILNNYLSKKLNFSHCSAIIFSEDIAKNGINKFITTLANNIEVRPTCSVIVSSSTAQKALESISNSNEHFSAKLYKFIINSVEYTGYSINPELNDIFYNLNSKNNAIVATYAEISDDDILQNTGIAIFDDDKFITSLSVLDSICYSLITNQLESCTIAIKNPLSEEEYLDIQITLADTPKIKGYILNNYPYIKIKCNLDYAIQSSEYNLDSESLKELEIIKNDIDSYIESLLLNFLYEISHEYNVDICDFQNVISSNYLTYDQFEAIHFNKIYKDSYFEIEIQSAIYNSGLFSKE
jgi:spore germination protein KC